MPRAVCTAWARAERAARLAAGMAVTCMHAHSTCTAIIAAAIPSHTLLQPYPAIHCCNACACALRVHVLCACMHVWPPSAAAAPRSPCDRMTTLLFGVCPYIACCAYVHACARACRPSPRCQASTPCCRRLRRSTSRRRPFYQLFIYHRPLHCARTPHVGYPNAGIAQCRGSPC